MKRRSRRKHPYIPTASMGDIAFLLIIFFMLCSNFVKEASITLTPPRSDDLEKVKETPVSVSVDEQGKIYLQGKEMVDAEAVEWGVAALLSGKTTREDRTVMFKCDQGVTRAVFEPLLNAIASGGGIIAAVGDKKFGEHNSQSP